MSSALTPEPEQENQLPTATAADLTWNDRVRAMWEGADYPAVAECLQPAARNIARSAGIGAGRHAFDLATGTGSVALKLADAGWQVTAIDLAPRLMSIGRRHAAALGLDIQWKQASMTQIPVEDASLDLVTSGLGLIFAPDPQGVLTEISRVLRTGGRLAFSAWTPTGTMGRMTSLIGEFLNRHHSAMAPFRWGTPALSESWLEPQFTEIAHRTHTLRWQFNTPAEATQWFFDRSPGHRSALIAAGEQGPALIAAVTTWMTEVAGGNHAFDLSPTYLLTTARHP